MGDKIYLCSYWPLIKSRGGRQAVAKFGLPPFINGMSRREPDFENPAPSITGSSRGRNFAPRLYPGDTVVYITTKGAYLDRTDLHWRIAAILEVAERFETHQAAAEWYGRNRLPLPSNCVVDGNPPIPIPFTLHHGRYVDTWDDTCIRRASEFGVFLACRPRFVELYTPPVLTVTDMLTLFDRVPNTRTPPEISSANLDWIVDRCDRMQQARAA